MRQEYEVIGIDEKTGEQCAIYASHRREKIIEVTNNNHALAPENKPHNPRTGNKLISFKAVDRCDWTRVIYDPNNPSQKEA